MLHITLRFCRLKPVFCHQVLFCPVCSVLGGILYHELLKYLSLNETSVFFSFCRETGRIVTFKPNLLDPAGVYDSLNLINETSLFMKDPWI